MHAIIVRTTVPMLLVLMLGAISFAGEPPKPQASSASSIEGTYRLVSRQFPDGTMLKPPELMGLWTYTKTHRNFNIVRKDATGKFSSRSSHVYLQADSHRVQRDRPLQYRQRPDRWERHCLRPLRSDPQRPGHRGRGAPPVQRCRSSRAHWCSRETRLLRPPRTTLMWTPGKRSSRGRRERPYERRSRAHEPCGLLVSRLHSPPA